jgi:hypothetical protein
MKHIKLFENFLNEDGYGRDFFVKQKDGKVFRYFFKIDGEEKNTGFIVSIGKLSKVLTVESAENSYCVISIEGIKESVMDDYLVKETDYKSNEEVVFSLDKSEFMRIYKIVGECIKDYLQNNPKVSTIYDQLPLNIDMEISEYKESVKNLMGKWSRNRWGIQDGTSDGVIIYNRRDHE